MNGGDRPRSVSTSPGRDTSDPGTGTFPEPVFRPDIQGLRTIAVLLVIVFHSGVGLSGGFLGVDVFFVISGFVIGRLLLHEQASAGRIALGRFYARRVRRLLPALALVLVFVAAFSTFALSPMGSLRTDVVDVGIGAALYVANFALLHFQQVGYFQLDVTANPLLHTWTLAVEEQFYLLFPLLLIGLARLRRSGPGFRLRTVVIVIAVLAICSFVLGAIFSGTFGADALGLSTHKRFAFYASPTRAWEFLAGVLVACADPVARRIGPRLAGFAGAAGVITIGACAWFVTGTDPTPGPTTLLAVAATALVIIAGTASTGTLQMALSTRPAVWVGDRSYGWYLWHWPVIVFVRTSYPTAPDWVLLIAALATLVPAAMSFRFLEQPIRLNRRWRGWRAVGLGTACCALSIVAFIGLANFPTITTSGTRAVAASMKNPTAAPTRCLKSSRPDDPKYSVNCTWAVPDSKGRIVLIGDSVAGSLGAVMHSRANAAGYDLNMTFRPGCPFADVERDYPDRSMRAECRRFVTRSMEAIEFVRPTLVVLASRESAYVHDPSFALRDPETGRSSNDESTKARLWQEGLARTLAEFERHDIPAVVIATVPQLSPFDIRKCPGWRLWTDTAGCGRTWTRRAVDDYRHASIEASRRAVESVGSASLVDFANQLCRDGACSTDRNGVWLYADSVHLSPIGALSLGPAVDRKVLSHTRDQRKSEPPPGATPSIPEDRDPNS